MRVALVCPYSLSVPGGVQSHVLGLAHWLGGRGHEPFVLAPGDVPPEVAARHHRAQVTSVGEAWAVPFNGSVARVRYGPVTSLRVRRWLDDVAPDLVHLHEPVTPSIALTALLTAGAPRVATYHTANEQPFLMRAARSVVAGALRDVPVHLAVSQAARAVVDDRVGVAARIVPNGFFPEDFSRPPAAAAAWPRSTAAAWPRSTAGRPWRGGGRPVIGFLGRLNEPRKGLDTLVDAWPAIRAQWPTARVVVAGAGERALPREWQSLGQVSDETRAEFLASCDVFVAPHLGGESFGLVLIEAMAAGARVIASDIPAFADVLTGSGQRLFRAGDPASLSQEIGDALTAASWAARPDVQASARRAFASRYAWDIVGPQIESAYAEALHPDRLGTDLRVPDLRLPQPASDIPAAR